MLQDLLSQVSRQGKMLANTQDVTIQGIERIVPLLQSDGVLHLAYLLIDSDYTSQILNFLSKLKMSPTLHRPAILKVVIDQIQIEQKDLIRLLESFQKIPVSNTDSYTCSEDGETKEYSTPRQLPANSPATNIHSLTLGNIEVSKKVMQCISRNLLPQLFSLELNQLTCQGKGELLEYLCHGLYEMAEENIQLIRLKISNIDLGR